MSLTRQIAYNTLVQSLGRVISALIGFGIIAAVSRYLGRAGFGQYTTATAFTGFFATIAGMGIALVVTNEVGKRNINLSRFLSNAFSLRLFTSLLILGLGAFIALFLPYAAVVKQAILIESFSFFLLSFRHVFDGVFFKKLKTIKLVVAEVAGRLFSLGLVFAAIFYDHGLLMIMWALAFGNLIQSLLVYIFAHAYARIRFQIDPAAWRYILKRSWPLALSVALNLIYFKFDTIMLSLLKPVEDVGIYGAAYKVLELLIAFPILFCNLVLPQLSAHRRSRPARFRRIFQKSYDALVMMTVLLVILVFFFSSPMITLIVGQDFGASVRVLQILSIAIGIMFISSLPAHTVVVLDQQKKMIFAYLTGAVLSIITNLIFIPLYSYIGAAVTTIFVELLVLILSFVVIKRAYPLALRQNILWRSLTAGGGLILFLLLLPPLIPFVLRFLFGVLVYFGILYLVGGINQGIVREFLRRKE